MGHATQPVLDKLTESMSKALAMARAAHRDAKAFRMVAPSSRAEAAEDAASRLAAAAEVAATATALLGRQERATQAQLYPTTGRDVIAVPAGPPTESQAPA